MRNLAIAYGNNRQAKTWVNKTIRIVESSLLVAQLRVKDNVLI